MNLIGDDTGVRNTDVDEDAPSPWESIEPEEVDREPVTAVSLGQGQRGDRLAEGRTKPVGRVEITPPPPQPSPGVPGDGEAATGGGELRPPAKDELVFPSPGTKWQGAAPTPGGDLRSSAKDELIFPSPGTPGEGQGGGRFAEGQTNSVRRVVATPPPLQRSPAVPEEGETRGQPACDSTRTSLDDSDESLLGPSRGGGWTIPLLCLGIGLIGCCLIIPQADTNRRMAYQKELLRRDLESIQQQVAVNDEFLKRVNDDSGLAERLAQRQMNIVREGSRVWNDGSDNRAASMSPYELTTIPRPVPLPPYQPTGGWFAALCREPRSNLYLTGAALMMLAAGLVLGMAPNSK